MLDGLDGLGVAIIAPSGALPEPDALTRAASLLSDAGARVTIDLQARSVHQRFAGDDASRLQTLYRYLDDPAIQIILAARGGYGLTRLLPEIDFARIAQSGKRLLGHSDFNTLQLALLARTGAASIVGPMACYDFGAEQPNSWTLEQFIQALGGAEIQIEWQSEGAAVQGQWQGILWGGNLSVLTSLLGTPYFPAITQGILFLEDVNEHPYRVERMLLQLHQAGVLESQRAIVLGDFSNYRLTEYDAGYDLPLAIQAVAQRCKTPLITGLPFGHCPRKTSLPMGQRATLQTGSGRASLSFAGLNLLSA